MVEQMFSKFHGKLIWFSGHNYFTRGRFLIACSVHAEEKRLMLKSVGIVDNYKRRENTKGKLRDINADFWHEFISQHTRRA